MRKQPFLYAVPAGIKARNPGDVGLNAACCPSALRNGDWFMREAGRPGSAGVNTIMAVLLALSGPLAAADTKVDKPQLVDRVAGNCYERRVLEEDGALRGYQRIFVHDWTRGAEGNYARIDVAPFRIDENQAQTTQVEEQFDFKLVGDVAEEAEERTALQIIGHLGGRKRIALKFLDAALISPISQCDDGRLPPVRFTASVEGGLVDILGGRAEVAIVDRACNVRKAAAGGELHYVINGKLRMDMFLLGIRFKQARYESSQIVNPRSGLIQYVLKDADGGRQEIRLADPAACSAIGITDAP